MPISEEDLKQFEALFDKKFTPIQNSIEMFIDKYDKLLNIVQLQETTVKNLSAENKVLKLQVSNLQNELFQTKEAVNDLEQYSGRECLEIKGIPSTLYENTDEIIVKVGSLVGVDIVANDISVSHRLPTKNHRYPPPIIAKFVRRNVRDELYHARKKWKDFSTTDLNMGAQATGNKIFISESLTSKNKELFNDALKLKKGIQLQIHLDEIWSNLPP